jgi:ribosomal protein S18 acetylase RimI-like enzyme
MRIRRASDADLDLVARLRLAFLADHRGVDPASLPVDFADATAAFVAERHHAGDLLTWLADDEGRDPVGGACVGVISMLLRSVPPRPEDRGTVEGYLINLWVPPTERRRGIGRLLLDATLAHARDERFRRVVLHFTDDGLPLYERAGFTANARWMELDLG